MKEDQVLQMPSKPNLTVIDDEIETKKGGGGGDTPAYVVSIERAANGFIVRAFTEEEEEVFIEPTRERLFKRLNDVL